MTWTHGVGAQASAAATTVVLTKPAGVADGQLLVAGIAGGADCTQGPPGWLCVARWLDDGGARFSVWCRVAASEPTTYTWTFSSSTTGIVLFDAFTSTVALNPLDCTDAYATVKASTSSTTLAGSRPFESLAGDLIVRFAGCAGTPTVTWASMTNLQALLGFGSAFEVQAATGQAAARTVTYGSAQTNRSETCVAFCALPPAAAVAHTVSDSGIIDILSPVAIDIQLTGLPSSLGTGIGNPVRYFEMGNIAWGTTLGYGRNYYLEHASEIVVAPFATCTKLAYSFRSGITAVITERLAL